MDKITFTLNGKTVTSQRPPTARLLDCLRDEFGQTGVKEGCGEGECGACAVLLDGRIANSCLVPLANAAGRTVVTIEGYRDTDRGKLLADCFAEAGAVQCGFCTPGMMIAAESLLAANPNPTDEEIREGISGNLCRCTGYNMIVDAVRMASQKGGGLW